MELHVDEKMAERIEAQDAMPTRRRYPASRRNPLIVISLALFALCVVRPFSAFFFGSGSRHHSTCLKHLSIEQRAQRILKQNPLIGLSHPPW